MKAFNPKHELANPMNARADVNRELIEHVLLEILPHGSGIDCAWRFDWFENGKVRASNSFHCMHESGMYDGYADFSLVFPTLQPLGAFRLAFHGSTAQRKARRYDLRDYLESTIYHAVEESRGPSIAAIIADYAGRTAGHGATLAGPIAAHIESFKE